MRARQFSNGNGDCSEAHRNRVSRHLIFHWRFHRRPIQKICRPGLRKLGTLRSSMAGAMVEDLNGHDRAAKRPTQSFRAFESTVSEISRTATSVASSNVRRKRAAQYRAAGQHQRVQSPHQHGSHQPKRASASKVGSAPNTSQSRAVPPA